jgi:dimethylargininase
MHAFEFNRALARAPSPSVVDGLRAVDVGAPHFDGVLREHAAYVRALEDAGVSVEVLPALSAYPDSLFVEDTALTFTGAAIVLWPGADAGGGSAGDYAGA